MKFYLAYNISNRVFKEDFVYPWEKSPDSVDGVLISKAYVNKRIEDAMSKKGVNNFLRHAEVIGDSGAFIYKHLEQPPYKPKDLLDYYVKCGFKLGCHLDHLVIRTINLKGNKKTLTDKELKQRWKLTLDNAQETADLIKKSKYSNLNIIGVIQGWDLNSYRESTKQLIGLGYNYLGIGGIARQSTPQVKKILQVVWQEIAKTKKDIKTHLFGIGRLSMTESLVRYNITSVDSASPYRKAWMSGSENYFMTNPSRHYTAIRIRINKTEDENLKNLEQVALDKFFKLSEDPGLKCEVLDAVLKYEKERLLKEMDEKSANKVLSILEKRYTRTLNDRPWKICDCPTCKKVGINVILFRQGWRNGSRAAHNIHHFYRELHKRLELYESGKQKGVDKIKKEVLTTYMN